MNTQLRFAAPLLILLLGFGATAASAQPAERGGGFELTARYSHTAGSALDAAGPGAEVGVDSYSLGLRARAPLAERTQLLYGLEWTRHELDLAGTTWLPESLKSLAAPLGVAHAFDAKWRLLVLATPRIAGADGSLSTARFDLPVLALASYVQSPELTWSFGLRYGARSEIAVLPIAGVAWQFAPEWELKVGWPESGVSWRATEQLTVRAVATINGGDFRLADDPRALAERVGPSLANTWLEYREIRVGLAAEYAFSRTLSVRAELGQVVDQRFEYIDRDVKLNGESPLYFGVGVLGRF